MFLQYHIDEQPNLKMRITPNVKYLECAHEATNGKFFTHHLCDMSKVKYWFTKIF